MKSPIIYVVMIQSLLTLAITSLFANDPAPHVVYSSCADSNQLYAEINCIEPNVVLMDEQTACLSNDLLPNLLKEHPRIKVIVIHQNSNRLEIFRKEEVLLTSAAGLLEIVNQLD